MDKKLAGLIGALSAAAVASTAQAAPNAATSLSEAMRADSYADLLKPIPNALELYAAMEAAPAPTAATADVLQVQYYRHHHHHHHHHRYVPRYHHHHHHHHRALIRAPGLGVFIR